MATQNAPCSVPGACALHRRSLPGGTTLPDVNECKGRPLGLCGAQSAQQSTGALVVISLVGSLFLLTSLQEEGCCSSPSKVMPPTAWHGQKFNISELSQSLFFQEFSVIIVYLP